MCKQYLLTEGNISKWKNCIISECNSNDFISECNSNVISEFYQKMYKNSIDIAPDISKMVSDNFWGLVQCDVPYGNTISDDVMDNWTVDLNLTTHSSTMCLGEGVTEEEYNKYLESVISEEEYADILDKEFNRKSKTFSITEEQSKLLSDFKKPLDYKCDKCGSSMYANMKFGVVELECESCGYYTEI